MFIQFILPSRTESQWRWKLFFTFLPLFIFGAIRVNFGLDYPEYEQGFIEANKYGIDKDAHYEVGYQYFNILMPSFRSVIIASSALYCSALAVFSYHNIPKNHLWLMILLIFLSADKTIYANFGAMRSGFAVSSLLLSTIWIQKRKILPFILVVALLSTIHTSAALFMPIAYFLGTNRSFSLKEALVWLCSMAFILFLSLQKIVDLILPFFSMYFERYENYAIIASETVGRGTLNIGANIIIMVMMIFFFYINKEVMKPKQNSIFRIGILYTFGAFIGALTTRMTHYYSIFYLSTAVLMFSMSWKSNILKYIFIIIVFIVSYYATFEVWMKTSWFTHWDFHSIWGDILY